MQLILFPILMAAAVAALVWALAAALLGGDNRKRLAQRLSSDGNAFRASGQIQSILLEGGAMTSLGRLLTRKIFFQKVQKQLAVAYPRTSLSRFVLFAACIGVTAFVVTLLAVDSIMAGVVTGVVVGYIPFMVIGLKVAKRGKTVNEQLPESLDFLARILRAGHSLSTGLQMMGTELPDPLASEFRRCYDQHSLGAPLQDCLKDMALRLESTEFSFFVTAVLIQRQTGGDLSMVLGNISATIRGRIRLAGFVKSKTAEGRFTGYVLVFFPILMFFVAYSLNPSYGGKLLHTPTGQKLLATAIGLQMIGLYAIKKLTTVKV